MLPENLSPEAQQIVALARQESDNLQQYYLGVEHLGIALTRWQGGITQAVLRQVNFDPVVIRDTIRLMTSTGDGHRYWSELRLTPRCEQIFKLANDNKRNILIEERDLLLAILQEGHSIPARALQKLNLSLSALIVMVLDTNIPPAPGKKPLLPETPLLDKFGRDITRLARDGKIEPVIGRNSEILHLIRTLVRKTKNNPMLIGEAGVGKTAVVEGLAQRIVEGKLVTSLRDKRLVELSMASIVAGTKYRGEFEERLMGIINECKARPDVVIFLDEIHTLVAAGACEGGLDASNILKPALARGEIKCIGATTITEYRKYIEKDPALERRFQTITVYEPSTEETLDILRKLRERYEKHHQVKIADSALEAAVRLTVKYVPDRRLPDKALDVLDEACTGIKVPFLSMYGEKEAAARVTDVNAETISEVISRWTGIPVRQLTTEEREKFANMADIIKKRVIGQDQAVEKVSEVVKIARAGLKDPRHPVGVFLFIGPTGVGKTELAKATAEFLFGSENEIIRLDMSEYMEKHSVSRLLGAPPGYIGHEEEGQLTGRLRRKPYSVVLLDEIEKASTDVFDVFLQVFDEGRLTDARGHTVDAKNAIFIMTSNIGSELFQKQPAQIGFNKGNARQFDVQSGVMGALKNTFRPEFLNRLDDVIMFQPLEAKGLNRIALNLVAALRKRLEGNGFLFSIADEALTLICQEGYDPVNGARPLARAIERLLTKPLSEKILAQEFVAGDEITASLKDGRIVFSKSQGEDDIWK
jgi:ATP-dependent Clp protease ATP-binding subunit ClpC